MNERDIFLAALEQPTAEARTEYLSIACEGDSALRQRVVGLLQMHENTGDFLQKPLVERLAEGVAALEDAAERSRDPSAMRTGSHGLEFLSPSDKPGSLGRLGHYEVQEVIGSGGMGIVLRAFDEQLHRVVAIKVMAAPLAASAASRKRFQREARAAAAVCHDHIVTIHAVEESGDLPYLVMQCVSGLSLQQRIDRDGPLELHEILRIGMQTAAGLAAAHAQGLIHRDIKPANILLENGVERVRITDFGLARAAADASISQSGAVIGTPQYMAPEQARGEALDGRTDLFSLGSVLYAMCTGRAPFRATNSIAVLKRVCEEAPSPIREANADIPEWLVALIDKLQAKNPGDRYQTAAEVAELLGQRLAQLQNSTALPPVVTLRSPPARAAGRGWRRWAFAAAAVLVLAASFGLAEGTGATKFTATVIRLLTPEGTLVVEMTDPEVKVTIDGDGGLVITGVGQHVVHLKLGRHTLQANKDGKPVPLDQELVTITRGDKPVVRVRLEGTAASAVAVSKAKPGAFVVLTGQGVEVRKFDTLAEAVQSAIDGDTIEIRGNGPFVIEPLVLKMAMTIRASAGFRPVITDTRDANAMRTGDTLLRAEGSLNLEGLEIHCTSKTYLILHAQGPLSVANCRFFTPGSPAICIEMATAAQIRNCELLAPNGAALAFHCDSKASSTITNCLLVGHTNLQEHDLERGANVQFTRNTFLSPLNGVFLQIMWLPPDKFVPDPTSRLGLFASENVFAGEHNVYRFIQPERFKPALEIAAAEAWLAKRVEWTEEQNIYRPNIPLLGFETLPFQGDTNKGKDLEEWNHFWKLKTTRSSQGMIRFHGGDLAARAKSYAKKLIAEDFRLLPESAGYKDGKDGKDLGAEVDLVGPGPAYERWKKMPDYQQWLKDTKQVTKSLDPDRKAAEWVLSVGGGIYINGIERDIKVASDLPQGVFQLTAVGLSQNPKVSDAGLAYFKDCKNLTGLVLNGNQVNDAGLAYFKDCKNLMLLNLAFTQVSDAGLAHFKDCRNLRELRLNDTQVGDAGLAHFKDCKNLTHLGLEVTKVSDAGLAHFKDCKNLTHLNLHDTQVSDAGLIHIQDCKALNHLVLHNTQVSDAGLERLAGFPRLTWVKVEGTKVTEAGVKKLAAALPKCKIDWSEVKPFVLLTDDAAKKEQAKWQGEWENPDHERLIISGDRWSWHPQEGPEVVSTIKIVEVTDKMTHVLLLNTGLDAKVRTIQAILRVDGDTLHNCGTIGSIRPTEFAQKAGYLYVQWKRVAKTPP